MRIAAPVLDAHVDPPAPREAASGGARGHTGGVAPEVAGLVGRIQCALIGSRALAITYVPDTTFVVLAAVAARAFGTPQVVALVERSTHRPHGDAGLVTDLAGAAGITILEAPDGPLDEADLSVLGIDTLAHPELGPVAAAPGPRLAAAAGHRVIHPLRDAGLTCGQVDALASALGLPLCLRRGAGT